MTLKKIALRQRRVVILLANIFFIISAYIVAFLLRFEFVIPDKYFLLIPKTLPVLILIKMVIFYYFGLFSGLWKYVSMEDLWQILKANAVSTAAFIFFMVFTSGLVGFPRSIFLLDWILCVGLLFGVRFITRSIRERYLDSGVGTRDMRTLAIGAGDTGLIVLKELRKNHQVEVAGFIDDDPAKKGMLLHGKKVFGGKDDIASVVDKHRINQIVIAIMIMQLTI